MPYRKRYKKRNTKKSSKAIAYKALKIAKSAKSSIETKFLDTFFQDVAVDWVGTGIQTLNNPDQGITDSERIGDSMKCTSLRWRLNIKAVQSNASAVRMIIFWDKFSTITSVTDVLTTTGSPVALVSDYKKDKRMDYNILHDVMYNIDGVRWRNHTSKGGVRLNKKTQFNGGSTNIEKGALKVFLISDRDSSQSPQPNAEIFFRCYYQDA